MNSLSPSYYTSRPINPDIKEKSIPLTEWEYIERHGNLSEKNRESVSDEYGFSFSGFSSGFNSENNNENDELMNTERIGFVDTQKIGQALQNELEFLSTIHLELSNKSKELSEATSKKISSAKYTYFDDLDAIQQLSSDPDSRMNYDFSNSLAEQYSMKSKQNQNIEIIEEHIEVECDSNVSKSKISNMQSSNNDSLNITSSKSNKGSKKDLEKDVVHKNDLENEKKETIGTMDDISSFHASEFNITDNTNSNNNNKTVHFSSLHTTKDSTKTGYDSDVASTSKVSIKKTINANKMKKSTQNQQSIDSVDSDFESVNISISTIKDENIKDDSKNTESHSANNNISNLDSEKDAVVNDSKNESLGLKKATDESFEQLDSDVKSLRNKSSKNETKRTSDSTKKTTSSRKSSPLTTERIKYDITPLKENAPSMYKRDSPVPRPKKEDDGVKPIESDPSPIPDLSPSMMKRKKNSKDRKANFNMPTEDDLRRHRKIHDLLGTQELINIEGPDAVPIKRNDNIKHSDKPKEVKEKEKKMFCEPGTTKSAKLRNQEIRMKMILQAEQERIKMKEDLERKEKERNIAERIGPDLRRLKRETDKQTQDAIKRRKLIEKEQKDKDQEIKNVIERVGQKSSLLYREGHNIHAKEINNRIFRKRKTPEEQRIEEIHSRRAMANERYRNMWK